MKEDRDLLFLSLYDGGNLKHLVDSPQKCHGALCPTKKTMLSDPCIHLFYHIVYSMSQSKLYQIGR